MKNDKLKLTRKQLEAKLKFVAERMEQMGFANSTLFWAVHREAFGLTGHKSAFTQRRVGA